MSEFRFTPTVSALPSTVPFVGPETQERSLGRNFAARLGANESVFGPSPQVVEAIERAASEAWMYGDPEAYDLRHALSRFHNVAMENIVIGEGIDGLLGTLVRLFVAPGDPVVSSRGAYPTFAYHVRAQGGDLTEVPYDNNHEDLSGLCAAAHRVQAKLIYLANPDNPMGSWHDTSALANMLDSMPKGCVLVLDEAYADLAPGSAIPPMNMEDGRLIRLRTFSKAHGLAGMRVGYGLGRRDLIAAFEKIRSHFGVGRLSQVAARAALEDQDWLRSVVVQVETARTMLGRIAEENGFIPLPSAANFVTMDCGRDGDYARSVLRALVTQDVFIRMPFVAPQDRCIRVSVGTERDLDIFAKALPKALATL